jgi:hypothetical protein
MHSEGVPEDLYRALGARKNSIKIREHTTEWKPHIVLRRVELDLDEDEKRDVSSKRLVYYSFFAAKSINVKPGKEILFALPGFGMDTQALVFEGIEDEDEDDNIDGMDENIYHPKMRKDWTRPRYDPAVIASECVCWC